MSDALRLAEALIACPSVTPSDAGTHALLAARLAAPGFRGEHHDAGPPAARVSNLWALRDGARPGPTVVLLGHTDVVPPGPLEAWASHPFVPTHRDGRLHGRGAADMKGAVAAMTVAAERFAAAHQGHAGRVALLFTSDEEGPARHGVRHVVEVLRQRGERIDACVVGEPTSVERLGDMVKNGRRGSLSARLRVQGVQGHVAYPQLARNPVHLAAPALAELATVRWDDGDAHFPPTTFQVSNVHAGTGALNVIPGELVVDFNFRFGSASTPAALRSRVEELLLRHGLHFTLEWTLGGEPFLTPPGPLGDALAAAIEAECGLRPELSTTGGTSDGRFMAAICREVMEFGAVNASIHQVDEWIDAAALEPLARVYQRVLGSLLA
ncbi:MAG: succinyl-diaminopimelate desuccinylase [Rubrivivax sp.]